MMDGLFQDIAEYIRISKDALGLIKGAAGLMPAGGKRDEAERQLKAAEDALKRSDAALAQKLGYYLCQCTYPPQIMLWNQQKQMTICQNPACGMTIKSLKRQSAPYNEFF